MEIVGVGPRARSRNLRMSMQWRAFEFFDKSAVVDDAWLKVENNDAKI